MAKKCPELKEKAKINRQSKDKRSLRTMAKLKDALFELMQETSLEDLSIQEICAKAKIVEGASVTRSFRCNAFRPWRKGYDTLRRATR